MITPGSSEKTRKPNIEEVEATTRLRVLQGLLVVGGIVTILLGILGDRNTPVLWNYTFGTLFLFFALVLQKTRKTSPVDILTLFTISLSLPLLVLIKGRSSLDIVWFLIYPGLAYYLLGLRKGLIVASFYFLVFMGLAGGMLAGFWKGSYTRFDYLTVLLVGFLNQAIVLSYEVRRTRIMNELRGHLDRLEEGMEREREKSRIQEELFHHQSRLAAMGEMVRAISHQWKQPLNAVGLIVQDLEDAMEAGELDQEYLTSSSSDILAKVNYMAQTIEDFRSLITGSRKRTEFSIVKILVESLRLGSARLNHQSIQMVFSCSVYDGPERLCGLDEMPDMEFLVFGPPNELKQIILNLLNNAVDAIESVNEKSGSLGGELRVHLQKNRDGTIHLSFHDSGPGIPPEHASRVTDPYFTTRKGGSGLGLYLTGNLMRVFPGEFRFKTNDSIQGGYVELVFFPRSSLAEDPTRDKSGVELTTSH